MIKNGSILPYSCLPMDFVIYKHNKYSDQPITPPHFA